MNAKLKITTIGNSVGVVLPRELLARLRVEKGDTLYVTELPDGELDVRGDERFVDRWYGRRIYPPLMPTTNHGIRLLALDGKLCARLSLIGGLERFTVRLGPLESVDQKRLPVGLMRQEDDDYWYVGPTCISDRQLQGKSR